MENVLQTETVILDPLEIKEEIVFEDENIDIKLEPEDDDPYDTNPTINFSAIYDDHCYVKEEKYDPGTDEPDFSGIRRIVDVNGSLINNDTVLNENRSPKKEPTSPNPDLENQLKKEPCIDCMQNIEHYCTVCNRSSTYSKNVIKCSTCKKNAMKLQCKICHKRYKFLNSVHQYVLQVNKKLNLLPSEKKQVTFTCRKENFFCSKCFYKATQKEQLTEHMKTVHNQAIDLPNEATEINIPDEPTAGNSSDKSTIIEPDSISNLADPPNKSTASNLSTSSSESAFSNQTALENLSNTPSIENSSDKPSIEKPTEKIPAKVKSRKKSTVPKNADINPNEDDDQFIELYCSRCGKICKRVVYDEIMKQVCRECQQCMLYRCILCTNTYKILRNIRYHVRCVCWHRINGPKLICPYCDYKAEVKSRLEFHIKSEHFSEPRNCPICNIQFGNATALRKHLLGCSAVQNNVLIPPPNEVKTQSKVPQVEEESDLDDVPLSVRLKELKLINKNPNPNPSSENHLDDGSYKIIAHDPESLVNEIVKRPPKDSCSEGWRNLVDYYCLQCDGEAKKKFSRYKPRCPKCKIKYDYRCISCEKLYGGYTTIYRHVKHECQNRYTMECSLCNYTSVRKYLLLNHIKSKHTVYKCLRCNCRCEGYLCLRKHQASECKIENPHGETHVKKLIALYCKHCYRRSRNVDDDNDLMPCPKCTMIMNFQCLKCNEIFEDPVVTYTHVSEECKPTFLCHKCDYTAYMQYDLDTHIKYKHTNRRCPDCGVQFRDEYIFRLHRLEELRRKEAREQMLAKKSTQEPEPKRLKPSEG